jgi:acetyl-CoA acyltransferase 1
MQIVDPKTGEETNFVISSDDGIRLGTTSSGLAKLKPFFLKRMGLRL